MINAKVASPNELSEGIYQSIVANFLRDTLKN